VNLGDILLSQLGKPHEPLGWGSLAVVAVILAVIAGEVLHGHAVSKLLGRVWRYLTRPESK
jgi:hypothetical protein